MDRIPSRGDEQFEVYRPVAEKIEGDRLLFVRWILAGTSNWIIFILPEEDNPFLGYRAIRISLDRKDLFKTQLECDIASQPLREC